MGEDEFEFCGKWYASTPGVRCQDCSMWDSGECLCNTVSKRDFVFPSCNNSQRKDGRDVIFVEKQQ